MAQDPQRDSYRPNDADQEAEPQDVLRKIRLPAAAAHCKRAMGLYVLTLLSAVDGTLIALGASGRLTTLGGALVVGLTVIAGAGSWVSAREAFSGRRLGRTDWVVLAGLGAVTLVATSAAVWLGTTIGQAATLHVLPKAAGLVMVAIGAEIAGLRLPRPGRVPVPLLILASAVLLEVFAQWIP